MPSLDQVREKFKGLTYQRRDNAGTSKNKQYAPKVNTFQDSNDLDMGVWFQKAKVLVSASEIIKTPEQKEKLMNVISPPPPKKVTFKRPPENPPPSQKDVTEDLPVILHTMDSRKEDHPPLYVSLMIGDLLLHNCMLDSSSSSNVMTKKVMNQLKLRPTKP